MAFWALGATWDSRDSGVWELRLRCSAASRGSRGHDKCRCWSLDVSVPSVSQSVARSRSVDSSHHHGVANLGSWGSDRVSG